MGESSYRYLDITFSLFLFSPCHLNSIGPAYMQILSKSNITSIDDLAQSSVERLQVLLNRSTAQSKKLIQEARRFPRFTMSVKELSYRIIAGKGVESSIEVVVDLRHTKKEMKRLILKDSQSRPYHLAALVTTTNVLVSCGKIDEVMRFLKRISVQGENCVFIRTS